MIKLREFLLFEYDTKDGKTEKTWTKWGNLSYVGGDLHVIEYKAYEDLQADNLALRAALEKLGCNETYHRLGGIDDCPRCLALFKYKEVR